MKPTGQPIPENRPQHGFTLTELMTSTALLAMMIAAIAPFASQVRSSAANSRGHQDDVLTARRVMETILRDARDALFTLPGPQGASVFTREGRVDYAWGDGALYRASSDQPTTLLAQRVESLNWQTGLHTLDVTLTLLPRRGTTGPRLRSVFALQGSDR